MCPVESLRPSSSSSSARRLTNGKVSLKIIEKRLNHLREELKNLTNREIIYTTSNLLTEQDDEHHIQYEKRLHQLSRLYDKQVKNLNLWHFYRTHVIDQMYRYEIHQSNKTFQTQKIDFKLKLIATLNTQRRYLDFEHQNFNIHSRNFLNNDQYLRNRMNDLNDILPLDGHMFQSNESIQQQSQRSTYNLRRPAITDILSETSSTTSSLKDLSIFSRSNSLLPPFGGIELQRCLSTIDIEQDLEDIQKDVCRTKSYMEKQIPIETTQSAIDVRTEDGRLWYQRAWFSRNTPIFLIFDDLEIIPALVLTVGRNDLLVRRLGTNIKHRISLSLLHDGLVAIRKRNCNL